MGLFANSRASISPYDEAGPSTHQRRKQSLFFNNTQSALRHPSEDVGGSQAGRRGSGPQSPELAYTGPMLPMALAPPAPPRRGTFFHSSVDPLADTRRPTLTNARRPTVFRPTGMSALPESGQETFIVSQQPVFNGVRLATQLVPASTRRATLDNARMDRDPTHIRLGETETDTTLQGRATLTTLGKRSGLVVLAESDDESESEGDAEPPKPPKAAWSTTLGWDVGPPRGPARGKKGEKSPKRKRNKARALDSDLDKFNAYAQNGQIALTRTRSASLRSVPLSRTRSHSVASSRSGASTVDPDLDLDERPLAVPVGDGFDALDVMADHMFRIGVRRKGWFRAPRLGAQRDGIGTGISIRAKPGLYRTFPVNYEALEEFEEAVTRLNPEVAIKIDSQISRNVVMTYIDPFPGMAELLIDENTRIQIIDKMHHLGRARKYQYAAFVRDEGVLVVWADMVENIIPAAEALEEALMQFIWRGEQANMAINQQALMAAALEEEEKRRIAELEEEGLKAEDLDPEDIEMRRVKKGWKERPTMLFAPLSDGLSVMLCMTVIALGLRTLVAEWALDGGIARFALFGFSPFIFCVALFACLCIIGAIFQTFGPIAQAHGKSTYFSGVAPKRTTGELPHVTIQMPVYKESLDDVIRPTVESLKKAITLYERQGGSAGIVICDDGLQLLPKEQVELRKAFYHDHGIAYVSRPGHNVDGFIRKGRFKKAGNLNFANALSLRVEEIMDEMREAAQATFEKEHFWSDHDENEVYDRALAQALEEKKGKAWAAGNIRYGALILLVDSDTRVPEDCFADAVSEMAESPEVAIIQHVSGVMQVANHFFENGVAFFTRSIQHSISFCCASGEVAPFVGHNAFLRWSALQECMLYDPDDGMMKIWSEDHVSEDFQIALTLQVKGYRVRWATYSRGEFEEGVSLTCDDELNRWQKYAWGCSELIFNPFRQWLTRGPITPLMRQFVWSNIPLHSKFTIFGYICSYYAIGCAWAMTVMNYVLEGLDIPLDGYYLKSWYVTIVCIIIFVGICNVSVIVMRYRLKVPDCGQMAIDQIMWIPFFSIFFTGMSMPMSAALVSHLVGYNMTWSTTVKSVERSNFFLQIPIICKRFWPQLIFFTIVTAAMITMSQPIIPAGYRITNMECIIPLAIIGGSHLLWPFALNPWFLSFSF